MPDWHEMTVLERDTMIRRHTAEGEAVYLAGGDIDECPYRPMTSQEAIWWLRGFGNARMGDGIGQ